MRHNDPLYIMGFAGAVCVVCSLLVSGSATVLKERQLANAQLDKQRKVLDVSGLVEPGTRLAPEKVDAFFKNRIKVIFVELRTGALAEEGRFDAAIYSPKKALRDPAMSVEAKTNKAGVSRVPLFGIIYEIYTEDGTLDRLVLPVHGKGLWSTLYGFVALDSDGTTIRGLTFYSHGETPGLGGEVDNTSWKARWPGRKMFDDEWKLAIKVIKGPAGSPEEDPHRVDGLSGATITSNGVTNLLRFWFGEQGFGPFLAQMRTAGSTG